MSGTPINIVCVCPVYNDWESFAILYGNILNLVQKNGPGHTIRMVAVDDASHEPGATLPEYLPIPVEVLKLKNNVGHQRAIAAGLQYVCDLYLDYDYVVVLDSDGEDRPGDIIALVNQCILLGSQQIIFARRKKRHETWLFRMGYLFYKAVFYVLTGQSINFGNFSCIPVRLMDRLVITENLWNHYSGSVIQAKIPYATLMLDRGKRYQGKSKMNSTSLILHGLSCISVYFDFLSVRILKISLLGVVACLGAVAVVLYYKLFTTLAIPGWASNLILIFFSIILQLSSVTLIVLLMQLSARKNIRRPDPFLYKDFVASSH
jgi:glycosyltransferase involved in cell wall biosynthesis